jgi:hypothetical protein
VDGAFIEYWLAQTFTIILENSANLDPLSKFVQVSEATEASAWQDYSVGNIVCSMHVIPEIATKSQTGGGRNSRWIVISRRDLVTWNDVDNLETQNCILHTG